MTKRPVDWTSWDEWKRIWEKWERLHVRINMEHIQFVDLYNLFLREVERLRREVPEFDPATLDLEGILSPDLIYSEAKEILLSVMYKPPTPDEYLAMYESYKNELMKQAEEKYPEVIGDFKKKIEELEKETERFPKVERDKAKFKKLSEDLRFQLEETIRRHEEEKAALEIFRKPPPAPTAPPEEKKVEWTRELERRLRATFETTLREGLPEERIEPLPPHRFWSEFILELDTVKKFESEAEMVKHIENFAKTILKREYKPPPAPPPLPPGWKKVINGYLTSEGEFVPEEEYPRYVRALPAYEPPLTLPKGWKRTAGGYFDPWGNFIPEEAYVEAVRRWEMKPPFKDLWAWIYQQYGLRPGEFMAKPEEEKDLAVAQYRKLALPPSWRSISLPDWLKEVKNMTLEEYQKLSNEEKTECFNEFLRYSTGE